MVFIFAFGQGDGKANEEVKSLSAANHPNKDITLVEKEIPENFARFIFQSGYTFEYPDAVRGIYVTGHSAGGQRFNTLLELINTTALNSMVIDIKDDHGYVTFRPEEDSPFYDVSQNYIKDIRELMSTLEENEVYPIA